MTHHTLADILSGRDVRRFTGPIPPASLGTPACLYCAGSISGPDRRFCSSRCYRYAVAAGQISSTCPVCCLPTGLRSMWCSEACRDTLIWQIVERDGAGCWICKTYVGLTSSQTPGPCAQDAWALTLDHWVPSVAGGEATPDNLRLAHSGCNQAKGEAIPDSDGHPRAFVHPDLILRHGPDARPDHPLRELLVIIN